MLPAYIVASMGVVRLSGLRLSAVAWCSVSLFVGALAILKKSFKWESLFFALFSLCVCAHSLK